MMEYLYIVPIVILIFSKRLYYFIYLKYILYKISKSNSTDLEVIEREGYKEIVITHIDQTHFKEYLSFVSSPSNFLFLSVFGTEMVQLDSIKVDLNRYIKSLKNADFLKENPEYGLGQYFKNDSSSIITYIHKRIYLSENPNDYNRINKSPFSYFKRVIVYYKNNYHNSIGFTPFLSTLKVGHLSEIKSSFQSINGEIIVPIKNEMETVEIDDIVGISFKNEIDIINLVINPQLHQITNYSDKSINIFFSSPKLMDVAELLNFYDEYGILNISYDSISLNVGYDDKSYLLLINNRSKTIYRGDSLVFRNGNNQIFLPLKLETMSFEGVFNIYPDINNQPSIRDSRKKSSINLEYVRFDNELLDEILQLPHFDLFYHNFSTDNYYCVLNNNNTPRYISNSTLFAYLLQSLPKNVDMCFDSGLKIDVNEIFYDGNVKVAEPVFVYVMIDKITGFYKIGISNNPVYREKTLMSQKPTIELLFKKEYSDRDTSRFIESSIHTLFSAKRVRGEWFDLTEDDLSKVKSILS
jgi:hypothetical protein